MTSVNRVMIVVGGEGSIKVDAYINQEGGSTIGPTPPGIGSIIFTYTFDTLDLNKAFDLVLWLR